MQLFERFRPQSWTEIVGQDKAIATIDLIRQRDGTLGGHAWFISGQSGTGKSSIAYLIAAEVSDQWGTVEVDDGALVNSELCDKMSHDKQARPFGRGYCYIVNEAHGLRGAIVRRLLGLCEKMPEWFTLIFTTTTDGKGKLFDDCDDSSPLLSRCEEIQLARRDLTEVFAGRLVAIAREAGLLNGHPNEWYLPAARRLLKDERNNMRKAINRAHELLKGGE